jgi:hypothetical protein
MILQIIQTLAGQFSGSKNTKLPVFKGNQSLFVCHVSISQCGQLRYFGCRVWVSCRPHVRKDVGDPVTYSRLYVIKHTHRSNCRNLNKTLS